MSRTISVGISAPAFDGDATGAAIPTLHKGKGRAQDALVLPRSSGFVGMAAACGYVLRTRAQMRKKSPVPGEVLRLIAEYAKPVSDTVEQMTPLLLFLEVLVNRLKSEGWTENQRHVEGAICDLIDNGAEVNITRLAGAEPKDTSPFVFGRTPLQIAIACHSPPIISALIRKHSRVPESAIAEFCWAAIKDNSLDTRGNLRLLAEMITAEPRVGCLASVYRAVLGSSSPLLPLRVLLKYSTPPPNVLLDLGHKIGCHSGFYQMPDFKLSQLQNIVRLLLEHGADPEGGVKGQKAIKAEGAFNSVAATSVDVSSSSNASSSSVAGAPAATAFSVFAGTSSSVAAEQLPRDGSDSAVASNAFGSGGFSSSETPQSNGAAFGGFGVSGVSHPSESSGGPSSSGFNFTSPFSAPATASATASSFGSSDAATSSGGSVFSSAFGSATNKNVFGSVLSNSGATSGSASGSSRAIGFGSGGAFGGGSAFGATSSSSSSAGGFFGTGFKAASSAGGFGGFAAPSSAGSFGGFGFGAPSSSSSAGFGFGAASATPSSNSSTFGGFGFGAGNGFAGFAQK